ncbi:MAG TPA: helix-turn-helix transcriptional regulator [Blastocatellia bacterium]
MTATELLAGRKLKRWNQQRAARKLGVSQPYLSLLEHGARRMTGRLARRAARLYELPLTTVPLTLSPDCLPEIDENDLSLDLAGLGYPGFSHLTRAANRGTHRSARNPVETLALALKSANLGSRVIEALPWVLLEFPNMDVTWLMKAAKLNDFQNRLGFVTNLAGRVAKRRGDEETARRLAGYESMLEQSRLAREGTLCNESMTGTERRWLRTHRPEEAKHWGLLTDLAPEHLSYANW